MSTYSASNQDGTGPVLRERLMRSVGDCWARDDVHGLALANSTSRATRPTGSSALSASGDGKSSGGKEGLDEESGGEHVRQRVSSCEDSENELKN